MLIKLAGTSGSGKTWAMRQTMKLLAERYGEPTPEYKQGRKRPFYYAFGASQEVSVLGSYDGAACGGCDTLSGYTELVELALARAKVGHVLMEGLLLSEDSKQTLLLSQQVEVRCLYLVTPIEKCIEQIKTRRAEAGNDKPLNEENTRKRVGVIQRARLRLEEAGILCRGATSSQVPGIIMAWLAGEKEKHKIVMGPTRTYKA